MIWIRFLCEKKNSVFLCSKLFVCLVSESVFTAYLHFNRGDVLLLRERFFFCGFSIVVFRVRSSSVFRLSVSGKPRFLPPVRNICSFGKIIRVR